MTTSGLVSNNGANLILNRAFSSTTSYTVPSVAEIGTDTTTATTSNTALGNRVPHTRTSIDSCDATNGWTHANDGGQVVLNTTAGDFRQGTGCLNTPSTYATGTTSWYKNVAGQNLSSNKYCGMFFYVSTKTKLADSASCVTLTLGTGGLVNTNYWVWSDDVINVGWNFLTLTADDPDGTEGTGAVESNVDYIELKVLITDSYTGTQMRMDQWWYSAETDHNIALEAGYPSFDTNNKLVTLRYNVSASEANNFDLGEGKIDNADTSPIQLLRITHDAFTKSTSYEVNYIYRIQIDNSGS